MTDFYVYEHWRSDTNRPFYVGKGRRYRSTRMDSRSQYHKNVVAKIGLENLLVKMVGTNLPEQTALHIEAERILLWREMGVELVNFGDGGEGSLFGCKRSAETKRRMSEAKLGKILSSETKKKMSDAAKRHWKLRKRINP